jgi:dTDP-4-dehydrorhamnose 3,5-epimerase
MRVKPLAIPDVLLVTPRKFDDGRGFFSEIYSRRAMSEQGIAMEFMQDNQSLSVDVGVVRGLHYQVPPRAQDKLVRVLRGRILDVAVDIRRGSPHFGKHVAVELNAEDGAWVFVPKGFAHGFMTLAPNTEILYKVSDFYAPEHDRGIHWLDPDVAVDWPLDVIGGPANAILSAKDGKQPAFRDMEPAFEYTGR